MTPVSLEDSVFLHFGTSSASTGAATNADSAPTVTVVEDGAALAYSPAVSNVTTGLYMVQINCTAANGFEAGKRYSVYVTATVGGITGRDSLAEYEVLATDINTGVASVTGAVGSVSSAVTVGTINANAVNAAALASDAVTEIQTGLALSTQVDALETDTTVILGRLTAGRAANLDNLDAQVSALPNASADALLDRANGVETGFTLRQSVRLILAVLTGKVSKSGDIYTFRDVADTKDRVVATTNTNGERTAVTRDAS